MRRVLLGMSQEKLGEALGLTFQQIQKYEKGTNRIGASRLQQISRTLNVPPSFFFDGAPMPDDAKTSLKALVQAGKMGAAVFATRDCRKTFDELKARGMEDCFKLLHFHQGSQITNIRHIKAALNEAAHVYTELATRGAGLESDHWPRGVLDRRRDLQDQPEHGG